MLARDLNESHIGQRFKFEGGPIIEGELQEILPSSQRTKKLYVSGVDRIWSKDFNYGYYIKNEATVIPLDRPVSDGYVKTKLAQYIRLEADKSGMVLNFAMADTMADIFMELMEGGTDANGER